MPRRAKRTQPPVAPPGLPYGQRGELEAAQEQVPVGRPELPGLTAGAAQTTPAGIVAAPGGVAAGAAAAPPVAPPPDPLAAAAAQPFAPVGLFGQSQRPGEAVMTGIGEPSMPAAPGDVALALEIAAMTTGDASLMAAADRARLAGL